MWHRAVPVLLLTACCTICKALTDCTSDPLELTFLVDLTPTETGHFELLKERIRQVFIVELLSLENIPQFAEETSVARALNAATVQFKKDGSPNARRVVFLAHDGINSDLVAETLEAVDSLKALNAHIFAIAAGPNNNGFALEGYTGHRSRVYADPGDVTTFEQALDLVTGACPSQLPETLVEQLVQSRKFALRALDSPRIKSTFSPDQECPRVKVDLMIVLDTSGSVHNAFDAERAFAVDLIKQFEEKAFEQDINVGLVRFASSADLLLPLTSGKTRAEILQKIMDIPFTGSNTKIASAVDLGVQTLQRYQREDAEQVFVLISDGHGQEFWNVVQATGKRLQQQDWEIFSVTASKDYNLAELTMYTGDASRVFIGPKSASFLPVVGKYINKCISEENKQKKTEEQRTKPPKDKTEAMEGSGVQDADCDLDIVLVVDRSQSVESDYQHELKTARDIVNLASADAFDSGKVKVGVTSFARDSNVELPLEKRPRQSVSDTIGAIFHTGGTTSAVKGVNEALKTKRCRPRQSQIQPFPIHHFKDQTATRKPQLNAPNLKVLAKKTTSAIDRMRQLKERIKRNQMPASAELTRVKRVDETVEVTTRLIVSDPQFVPQIDGLNVSNRPKSRRLIATIDIDENGSFTGHFEELNTLKDDGQSGGRTSSNSILQANEDVDGEKTAQLSDEAASSTEYADEDAESTDNATTTAEAATTTAAASTITLQQSSAPDVESTFPFDSSDSAFNLSHDVESTTSESAVDTTQFQLALDESFDFDRINQTDAEAEGSGDSAEDADFKAFDAADRPLNQSPAETFRAFEAGHSMQKRASGEEAPNMTQIIASTSQALPHFDELPTSIVCEVQNARKVSAETGDVDEDEYWARRRGRLLRDQSSRRRPKLRVVNEEINVAPEDYDLQRDATMATRTTLNFVTTEPSDRQTDADNNDDDDDDNDDDSDEEKEGGKVLWPLINSIFSTL